MSSVYPSALLFSLACLKVIAQEPANVYVYAQRLSAAKSWITITCDGTPAAKLKRGTLFAITVANGRHSLSLENGVPITIQVRDSEDAYIRLDWSYNVGRAPIPVLSLVRPEKARAEVKFLSYVDGGKMLSPNVVKTDPRPPAPQKLQTR